jgi:hypothetical protein
MKRIDTTRVAIVGIGLIVLLLAVGWATGQLSAPSPQPVLTGIAGSPSPGLFVYTPSPTPTPTRPVPSGGDADETATPVPAGETNPLPVDLPPITPPPGGQVYIVTPVAEAVGWAREGDETPNHLGDYNVYAGVFDGQRHVGMIQFDLVEIPPGAPVVYADLTLVGLSQQWLGDAGTWTVQLLSWWMDENWSTKSFGDVARGDGVAMALAPVLTAGELGVGQANVFRLGPEARQALAARVFTGKISFRIDGPASGGNNLFAWDSGHGTGSRGWVPVLRIASGPVPAEPVARPTLDYVVITATPTPANVVTAAALAATATFEATTTGTPTPQPLNWATPVVLVATATPANAATAEWYAAVATAEAWLQGTPTAMPGNIWTATPPAPEALVVVTNTPTPGNWATAVALAEAEATRQATAGTPTPFPPFVATATPRYVVVTATPQPENVATVQAIRAEATIVALREGTYTPTPANWVTPTATRVQPTPLLIPFDQLERTPTPTATPIWRPLPAQVQGKIAFVSDRMGREQIFVMDPDGSNVALLTERYPYDQTLAWEGMAPDGARQVLVQTDERGRAQLYLSDSRYGYVAMITHMKGMAYDPAWAPNADRIAFVGTEAGNDEIYTVSPDGSGLERLTHNTWEWDKRPSWSPDGRQIVFYSNRYTGRQQIWIMNADGSGQRNLSDNEYNDWDPVWIK